MARDELDMAVTPILTDLLKLTGAAVQPVQDILATATSHVRAAVTDDDRVSATLIEENQTAAHGLAWLATYAQSLHQMQLWAEKLDADGTFSETEQLTTCSPFKLSYAG